MIDRQLHFAIESAIRTFPAVVVTGPRQSGKTTLLRKGWGSSHKYVSLENPDIRHRALADPIGFLKDHAPPVIFDEIQYATELLPYIKSSIDDHRLPGQWLLTGSQNFSLMAGVGESLAGRVAVLSLLPLSLEETVGCPSPTSVDIPTWLNRLQNASSPLRKPEYTLTNWLLRGGYPELRANREVNRELWCASYIQTYLERDVRQILHVGDLNGYERFVRLVAARTGQVLNYSDLARDAGISPPTARNWISVLEAGGLVYLLPPYFANFGKRIIKSPKLYFLDTALASFLMGLHTEKPLKQGPFMGAIMETMLVSEWVKFFRNRGLPPPLYYWRSRDGLEIDLLVEYDGCLYPMEIKSGATVSPHDADALTRWYRLAGGRTGKGLVFADVDQANTLKPDIRAIPWWWI